MAETDITVKSTVPSQSNPPAVQPEQKQDSNSEERVVNIRVIGAIAAGDYESSDYHTAKRAWELFVEAGIEPQDLIAGGLAQGEKYRVSEITTKQLLKKSSNPGLTGESRATDEALLAYRYSKATPNLIGEVSEDRAMVRIGENLAKTSEGQEIIEATVILPDRQSKIAESVSYILPEEPEKVS